MDKELYQTFGYALAMRVLQSDLYRLLDDTERAECDELIQRGQSSPQAMNKEREALVDELDGVIADCEMGNGFDDVCLRTIKRVRDALTAPQQEPVAWVNEEYNALSFDQPHIRGSAAYEAGELRPLIYGDTAPQPTDGVVVPSEPTYEMLCALSGEWHPSKFGRARERYAALLAAAKEQK